MFKNLKVRTRLIAGFLFLALVGAVVAGIGVLNLGKMHDQEEAMYERELMGLSYIKEANINLISLGRARSNFLLADTDAERKRQMELRRKYEAQLQENLAQAKPLFVTQRAKELFANLDATWKEYEAAMDKTYALAADEEIQQRSEDLKKAAAEARSRGDHFGDDLHELSAQKEARAKAAKEEGSTLYESSRALMLGLVLFALAISIILGIIITHSIVRPLDRAVEIAKTVAAGDLTSKIEIVSTDEFGHMLQALKEMNESLAHIVGQVRTGTETISSAANQIAAGNMDLSSRTEQQAGALEETASSMEELTATVKQNAENAQQANQLALSATEVAVKGGEVVAGVVVTMNDIEESAKKIAEITNVIDGIAFQTNILALNAAVEAARAGEQGRGFAVVASEVRSLARRSADAAKEIKGLITESVQKVDAGAHLVEHAGETMRDVVSSIKRVTDLMGEIAAASREQASGIEQVNRAVSHMDEMTQNNASLVEEAAAAAQSLHDQADQLAHVVGAFNLDTPAQDATAGARMRLVKSTEPRSSQQKPAHPVEELGFRPRPALAG